MAELYKFDDSTGQYVPVKRGLGFYLRRYGLYALLGLVALVGFLFVFYFFYDSPKARLMKVEQQQLLSSVEQYEQDIAEMAAILDELERRNRGLHQKILNAPPIEGDGLDSLGEPDPNQAPTDTLFADLDIEQLNTRIEELNLRLEQQRLEQQQLLDITRLKKEELAFIPSIRPVPTTIISGFGIRQHPIFRRDIFHQGIDFKADMGSDVVATANGRVLQVGRGDKRMGVMITIDHGNGYRTKYAHLSGTSVVEGQRVERGQVIGQSGDSGLTKGPHLYYELLRGGKAIDPIDYFFNDLEPAELVQFRRKAAQYNESMG